MLMTPAEIKETLKYALEKSDESGDAINELTIQDYASEQADSYVPVYTHEIIKEWCELPSDFCDRWQDIGADSTDTIVRLMTLDLWLYYQDQFILAYDSLAEEYDNYRAEQSALALNEETEPYNQPAPSLLEEGQN